MKKIIAITIAAIIIISMAATAYAATGFTDVSPNNWAANYINQLTDKGGINGYPDGTFKPQNSITAAEFIKITVSLLDGAKAPTGTHWASGYIDAAAAAGIIPEGMISASDWNSPMTRQKMAILMELSAEKLLHEDTITDSAKLKGIAATIADYTAISDNSKGYIVQAVGHGLITGYPDGTFGSEKTATRAEAAAMIIRLIDKTERIYPASSGKLSDLVSNPEALYPGIEVTSYIYDPNAGKYAISVETVRGVIFLDCKDLYVIALIKDGKIIESAGTTPAYGADSGYRSAVIHSDITATDYIASYDNYLNTVTVIPNPLKK